MKNRVKVALILGVVVVIGVVVFALVDDPARRPAPGSVATPTEQAVTPEPSTVEATPDQTGTTAQTGPTTTGGLDAASATVFCQSAATAEVQKRLAAEEPPGRPVFGILAQEYRQASDSWFIKFGVTGGQRPMSVECTISGTKDAPSLDVLNVY